MSLSYAAANFYVAVQTLASGDSPLRDRIRDAWDQLHRIKADDVPEDCREKFRGLEGQMTRHKGPEGSFTASASRLTDEEARKHAEDIVSIFLEVAPYFYGENHVRPK